MHIKVLDPRLKLKYYEEHKWDSRWIKVAKETALTAYDLAYAPSGQEEPDYLPAGPQNALTAHLFKKRRLVKKNEMDAYMGSETANIDADILEWWKVKYLFFIINATLRLSLFKLFGILILRQTW